MWHLLSRGDATICYSLHNAAHRFSTSSRALPTLHEAKAKKRADALATAGEANSQKHDTQKKERQFKDFSLYKPTLNDNIKRDQKGRY